MIIRVLMYVNYWAVHYLVVFYLAVHYWFPYGLKSNQCCCLNKLECLNCKQPSERSKKADNLTAVTSKMNLLDLPEEILIKLLRSLDTKSLFYVHGTCSYLRHIMCMPGVIRVCKLSLSPMASAHYLNFKFFMDLKVHLLELDLSCVPNIEMPVLLNSLMTMKVLKVLDVSYTKLNIMDLIEIHLICPTINDISINFDFGRRPWSKIPPEILEECKTLFESFRNVCFVGGYENLFRSNLPLSLLERAKLARLQLTITGYSLPLYDTSEKIESVAKFDQIIVYFLNWNNQNISPIDMDEFYLASMLDINKFEFICIVWWDPITHNVSCSPLFKTFFKEKFNIDPLCLCRIELRLPCGGNVVFMVWNKESTVFDEVFYKSLFNRLQGYFPHYHKSLNDRSVLPANCDWLFINHFQQTNLCHNTLDLDAVTAGKETLKLTIYAQNNLQPSLSLPAHNNYMHKITYIALNGVSCYGNNFFSILFKGCIKLKTVNFTFQQYSSAVSHNLCEALPLSKSLKNFMIVSPHVEMQYLLAGMCKCRSLENIQIVDLCSGPQPLSLSRAIFQNCADLYSFVIAMEMPPDARSRKLKILNKFKLEYKRFHLHIQINSCKYNEYSYEYDPFIGVFDLCPLKPL